MQFNREEAEKYRNFENSQAVAANIFTRERDEWSASQTEKSYQQQEYMFNRGLEAEGSAYQRSMADMKKAGLNPLMMYAGGQSAGTPSAGGAGAPQGGSAAKGSGAQASMRGQGHDYDFRKAGDAVNSALQSKKIVSDIKLVNELAKTEGSKQVELAERARSVTGKAKLEWDNLKKMIGDPKKAVKKVKGGWDKYRQASKAEDEKYGSSTSYFINKIWQAIRPSTGNSAKQVNETKK